jgi:hypothetical protein
MKLRDLLFGSSLSSAPRASLQSAGPGTLVVSPQQLEEALREGNLSDRPASRSRPTRQCGSQRCSAACG